MPEFILGSLQVDAVAGVVRDQVAVLVAYRGIHINIEDVIAVGQGGDGFVPLDNDGIVGHFVLLGDRLGTGS